MWRMQKSRIQSVDTDRKGSLRAKPRLDAGAKGGWCVGAGRAGQE